MRKEGDANHEKSQGATTTSSGRASGRRLVTSIPGRSWNHRKPPSRIWNWGGESAQAPGHLRRRKHRSRNTLASFISAARPRPAASVFHWLNPAGSQLTWDSVGVRLPATAEQHGAGDSKQSLDCDGARPRNPTHCGPKTKHTKPNILQNNISWRILGESSWV